MYPLLLCRGAMPEIILTTIRPPSSGPTHPDYQDFPPGPTMGTSGQRREENRQLGGDFDSMMEVVTVLIQWCYNDNPGVECGKGGESVVSIVCLYSLAGAKWEIIAAGGTLHRLESIHTANTDRKGCGQLRVLFDLIKTQIILLYSLFQGEVRNIMW